MQVKQLATLHRHDLNPGTLASGSLSLTKTDSFIRSRTWRKDTRKTCWKSKSQVGLGGGRPRKS